jgi:hypothetical protein
MISVIAPAKKEAAACIAAYTIKYDESVRMKRHKEGKVLMAG